MKVTVSPLTRVQHCANRADTKREEETGAMLVVWISNLTGCQSADINVNRLSEVWVVDYDF